MNVELKGADQPSSVALSIERFARWRTALPQVLRYRSQRGLSGDANTAVTGAVESPVQPAAAHMQRELGRHTLATAQHGAVV